MKISDIINKYGEKYSPYMSGLVNHLPMGQLALYKITGDLKKVEAFTRYQVNRSNFDPVREEYPECRSTRNCLGKRDMYESYLKKLKKDIKDKNAEEYVSDIINTYPLGMSSGLFHTIIRLYFAMEGYKLEKELLEEVRRATSYYVTAYRKADVFMRRIDGKDIVGEMEKLMHNERIQALIYNEPTTGKKMRAMYSSVDYLQAGFVIDGDKDEKVEALLSMLFPIFINTGNIVVLHCITGLQAVVGLEEYFDDFDRALDILTTTIITHLMTLGELNLRVKERDWIEFSWEYILSLGSESVNVHNIKFAYSCHEISKKYPVKYIKRAALKRIDTM